MTHSPYHFGGVPGMSGPPGRNYPVSKPFPAPSEPKQSVKGLMTSDKAYKVDTPKKETNESLMSDYKKPEAMKPNPKLAMYFSGKSNVFGGLHHDFGKLADELAMFEGFEKGIDGARDSLRHTLGSSYVYQGQDSDFAKWLHKTQIQLIDNDTMNLWYAKGGPNEEAIENSMGITFSRSFGKLADAHNNTLGSSGIFDGLSFEQRYEKVKDMMKEQLEYYSKTGEFKSGLPVWRTDRTTPNDAAIQLQTLNNAEENLIESRRMGLLSQPDKRELSNLEQVAEMQRDWRMTSSLNQIAKHKDNIESFSIALNKLKTNKPDSTDSIKSIEASIKISKENLQKELDRVEERGGLRKLTYKRGISTEEAMTKALEEKTYMNALNVSKFLIGG